MIIRLRRYISILVVCMILGITIACDPECNPVVGTTSFDPCTFSISPASLALNLPPDPPCSPVPCDGECNVSIKVDLTWNCSDPDGDPLFYDVYFGTSAKPAKLAENLTETQFYTGKLRYETTYYWRIVAYDTQMLSTAGPCWSFTTGKELHHPIVELLYPKGGETLNDTITVQWHAYDIEDKTNVTIFLYYSRDDGETWSSFANNPMENTGECSWNTTTVQDGTYLLQVVARDSDALIGHVTSTSFYIRNHEEPPDNHPPEKPIRPTGEVNGVYKKEYPYSTRTVDPDDDQIYYKWDWGDGTISEWKGPYASNYTVKTSHLWKEQGTYKIKVMAKDTYGKISPWSDMLPIVMPKHRVSSILWILVNKVVSRYPLLNILWT